MSDFVFNLNGSLISPENKAALMASSAKFESALSAKTPDSQLTYTGNDNIVWDRVNGERLRRGIPSLTELGYPRPPDDPTPNATTSTFGSSSAANNPETYKVSGPPGMTMEQALAVFKQQTSTGSLVGFKVGDALSAVTQATDGLASAQAALAQGIGGLSGKLPTGADLNTITASLGTNGASALAQASAAIQGAGPAISSSITQATSAIQGALPQITSSFNKVGAALGVAIPGLASQMSVASQALTGQAAQIGSIASTSLNTLASAIKQVPTDGINVSEFVKQIPAASGIGNLNAPEVTGALAQASKMVGQAVDQVSNALGAGKFGFDASQLERAGMIKPGTVAAFLEQGKNDLVAVLKSPTVWTGKDGVKNLEGLLNSPGLQDKIQQGLMSSGLNDIKQLGIPVDKLNPEALSGLATNAAKSVQGAFAWATNPATIPQIPTIPGGDVKAAFDAMATNSAFAVKLADTKIEPALKQEMPVVPATNTVNAETVSAAATRVVGNEKVPTTASGDSAAGTIVYSYFEFIDNTVARFNDLQKVTQSLAAQTSVLQEQWDVANEQYQLIRATYNARNKELSAAATAAVTKLSQSDPNYTRIVDLYNSIAEKLVPLLLARNQTVKQIIADLANKIVV